jgi:hypothetical protein
MQNVGSLIKCIHVRYKRLKTGQITEYTLPGVTMASSNVVVQTLAATMIFRA